MSFDQGLYWKKRGKTYINEFDDMGEDTKNLFDAQEKQFIDVLGDINFDKIDSVLEIGSGFGRVTKLMLTQKKFKKYDCIDISQEQISNAIEYLSEFTDELPNFVCDDFKKHSFNDTYDLVIASEIFLHFPPNEIGCVLNKAQKLSKCLLIHIDPIIERKLKTPIGETLNKLLRAIQGKVFTWDWDHYYLKLYDLKDVKQICIFPILSGKQFISVVLKDIK